MPFPESSSIQKIYVSFHLILMILPESCQYTFNKVFFLFFLKKETLLSIVFSTTPKTCKNVTSSNKMVCGILCLLIQFSLPLFYDQIQWNRYRKYLFVYLCVGATKWKPRIINFLFQNQDTHFDDFVGSLAEFVSPLWHRPPKTFTTKGCIHGLHQI